MSKKQKTTTSQTTNSTMTPTNPEWVTQGAQGLAGKISDLGNMDPYSLVAGADPLQTQAAQGAAQLGGDRGWYDKIMGGATPSVGSASLLDGLEEYMSPYTKDVVDTSLADYDFGAGQTRAQQQLDMAGAGAFGGSGAALTQSMTEGELSRGRGALSAGLRDQAFTRGAGLSSDDAGRRQQASIASAQLAQQDAALKAQLGLSAEASDRSNVGLMGDIGTLMRQIEQSKLSAPVDQVATQTGLFGGLPLGLFGGKTLNETGTTTGKAGGGFDWGKWFGGNAMIAAKAFGA